MSEVGNARARAVWLETLRRLTPERKLEIVFNMMDEGFYYRVLGVRLRFPEMSEDETRRRAVAEMVESHLKNSGRRSPLFESDSNNEG